MTRSGDTYSFFLSVGPGFQHRFNIFIAVHSHEILDSTSSSYSSLTPYLDEIELGMVNSNPMSFESEANKVGDRLVASGEEFVNSDIILMHCNLSSHDHNTLAPKDLD